MTAEEKEAIEYLINHKEYFNEQIKIIEMMDTDYYDEELNLYKERKKQFQIVLNLIQKQEKQIQDLIVSKVNEMIENKQISNEQLESLNLGWKIECDERDKVIDRLANLVDKMGDVINTYRKAGRRE